MVMHTCIACLIASFLVVPSSRIDHSLTYNFRAYIQGFPRIHHYLPIQNTLYDRLCTTMA